VNPERWQQINELFLAALERAPSQRVAFISEAAAGDEELRREVESLLASHEAASQFIEEPLVAEGARLLAGNHSPAMLGRQIGHYRILSLLGTGGMGEVYLAEDSRLGRSVAIKILPVQFSQDRDRVRRLQQEARAASALNHPNILTIHEIGEFEGRHFIATEFIDGETLRERLSGDPLSIDEALDVTIQVASALVKAHAAGIAHRDIKPDNIMVNRDGYIKVLDFGLAKLTERPPTLDGEAPTRAMVNTEPGMVMGTANYMSPEQARGSAVDTRTDLWSLGVVLYQMLSGRLPFEGATPTEVIAKVLEREPASLADHLPDLPDELERVVHQALIKEREARYQTASDLLVDLKSLRRHFESGQLKYNSESRIDSSERVIGGRRSTATAADGSLGTDEARAAVPTSSAEYIVTEIKRHKTGAALAAALLIIAVGGVGIGLYKLVLRNRASNKPIASFNKMKITRLNTRGHVTQSAISRDGKYVAYATEEGGKQSLWVRQVATGSDVQVVPAAEFPYFGLTFTNDGDYIYYVIGGQISQNVGVLYQVPTLGGTSKKLLTGVDSAVTFSPDGKLFAFVVGYPNQASSLVLANSDGTGEHKIAIYPDLTVDFGSPAWSPDGKVIACVLYADDSIDFDLFEVKVADGTKRKIASRTGLGISSVAWLPDGTGLIATAFEIPNNGLTNQIWRISYPGGEFTRVTNDLNRYTWLSLTADSATLTATQEDTVANLWVAPSGDMSQAKRISSNKFDGRSRMSWTPDGKLVHSSMGSGKWDLWIMDADGTNQKQLTSKTGNNWTPVVTSDGRYIIFTSDREGNENIWRINVDGSDPKQLTNGPKDISSDCTPDGRWVVYDHWSDTLNLWKVPIEGGEALQLTHRARSWIPQVSKDGKSIAFLTWVEERMQNNLAIMSLEGGHIIKVFNLPEVNFRWSPSGNELQYATSFSGNNANSSIWSQPLSGGPPKQIADVSPDVLFSFAWSRDGKQLAFGRGTITKDVVLITDFK
jgi:eukaryotic-like serine/threonine-protein kinase